jgi:hypothetical protein
LPAVSTATQNVVEGQETDVRLFEPIMSGGLVHVVPPSVEVSTDPASPTATQNDAEGHAIPPML